MYAAHFTAVVPAALHQVSRHDTLAKDLRVVIDVLEKQVDGGEPLREPSFESAPLGRRDDARHQVERKDALDTLMVPVDREGDALRQKCLVGLHLTLAQLGVRRRTQRVEQGSAMRTWPAGWLEHLVVGGAEIVGRE